MIPMVNETVPRTLTPYDLVASETETDSSYVARESESIKGYEQFNNWSNWGNGPTDPARKPREVKVSLRCYEQFNNWSNWGNGPTDPARAGKGLEKALS